MRRGLDQVGAEHLALAAHVLLAAQVEGRAVVGGVGVGVEQRELYVALISSVFLNLTARQSSTAV